MIGKMYTAANIVGLMVMLIALLILAGALMMLRYETYGSPWGGVSIFETHRNIEEGRLGDSPIGTVHDIHFLVYDHPVSFENGFVINSPPNYRGVDITVVNMRVRPQN